MANHLVQNTVNNEVSEMTDTEYRNAKSRQKNLKIVGKAKASKPAATIKKEEKPDPEKPDEQAK